MNQGNLQKQKQKQKRKGMWAQIGSLMRVMEVKHQDL